jgi:hypothetical protein
MLLKNLRPRTIFRLAMLFLIAFFSVPLITRSWTGLTPDIIDGTRGGLLGVTLGLLVVFQIAQRRQAR